MLLSLLLGNVYDDDDDDDDDDGADDDDDDDDVSVPLVNFILLLISSLSICVEYRRN